MSGRVRRIGGEVAKFSAVNVVATVVAIVLFNLLVHGVKGLYTPGPLNGWPVTSWFVANCVGMAISYYGSLRYAFKNRRAAGPAGGALNYVVINLVSFVIPMTCLWVTRNVFEWESVWADNISGNVIGGLLGTVVRFLAFRTFVFKRDKPHLEWLPPEGEETAESGTRFGVLGPEVGPDETKLVEHQP